MHFLYNYIKSIRSLRELLFMSKVHEAGVDSLDVTKFEMEDGSVIEICSIDNKEVCRMHYSEGNMIFYEKNIQSKNTGRENIYSAIERNVPID